MQANPALYTDLRNKYNSHEYVYAATLAYHWSTVPYATSITPVMATSSMNIGTVTWNSRPACVGYGAASVPMVANWNTYDITGAVGQWQTYSGYTYCNLRLSADSGGRMLFRSKENAYNTPPVMTVDYAPTPSVILNSPHGDQFTSTPQANWTFSEANGNPQVEYQIEVDNYADGTYLCSSDVMSDATSAPLPVPPGGWVQGHQYTVYVSAASQPIAGGPMVLSANDQGTFTTVDGTPPTTTADAAASYVGTATISLAATDNAGGTGVARTYYALDSQPFTVTGGTQSVAGSSTAVTFDASGSLVCSGSVSGASALVVGGGGGGGGQGGGGAGGVVSGSGITLSGTMNVTAGPGGGGGNGMTNTFGANGGTSVLYNPSGTALLSAFGGGGGAPWNNNGAAGASGGGGGASSSRTTFGGSAAQGYSGGGNAGRTAAPQPSGGGGGAGAPGGSALNATTSGSGGVGTTSAISGAATCYGGGGGGGVPIGGGTVGRGGNGGGGAGGDVGWFGGPGAPNTGGGGGGGGWTQCNGGSGGSGVVVVSYPTPAQQRTGTTIVVGPPSSGTVTHAIYYWSVDNAGNAEIAHTATFTVAAALPAGPVVITSATTTSSGWFTGSTPDDTNAAGRGSATLTWSPVPGATTYNIYLLDGATYQRVGMASSTSWTSAGAGIYPTDSQIVAMPVGTIGDPYPGGTGLDLRDDPTPLYAKMAGATVAGIPAYFFKVTAANAGGETTLSAQPTITVQLAERTVHANEAPAHTTRDLGTIAGDSGSVQLDNGALTLSATDLSVASFGPEVALTRTYRSSTTSATTFAPGWRFGFEQSVTASGTCLIYTDDTGESYRFTAAGAGAWAAPHGMVATITASAQSGPYTLTLKGGTTLSFDTSGKLAAETDRHNDATTYAWSTGQLVISAANDWLFDHHQIIVTLDGSGHVTKATNTQDGLTREVDYAITASSGTVTRHLTATETVDVVYSYQSSPTTQLAAVTVSNFAPGGVAAAWTFAYDSASRLTGMQYPATTVARPLAIAYPSGTSARVSTRARVGDLASSDSSVTETFVWDTSGRETAHGNPTAGDLSQDNTATTSYGPGGQPRLTVSAAGVIANSVTDSRGNELVSSDADGHTTTNVFNSTDDLISTTDPKGAQTLYTYNTANGDMLTECRQLSASDWAQTTYDFAGDGHGRAQSVTKMIDATHSAVTQFSGYGDFTQPQTTTEKSVSLDSTSGATVDLTTQRTFDGFGQLASETDPANVNVTTNAYDLSGHLISSSDAIGTVTHHRYDVLGNEVETSHTAGAAWVGWTSTTIDPTGLVLTETSFVTSGGAVVAAATTTHVYDGSGQEIKAAASNVGTTTTAYDSQGDVSATWDPAATSTTTTSTAQTTVTDADSRQLQSQVTTGAPAVTAYTQGSDEVASYSPPDAAATTYRYDIAGNQTTQIVPTSSGTTSTTSAYDLGGRQTSSTDASGNVTTTMYDLLGHMTKSTLQGIESSSTTTYNALGWVLTTTDPTGMLTRNVYDKDGRLTDQVVSVTGALDAITHHDFDLVGNEINTVNPDGSSVQATCDAFGRMTRRVEYAGGTKVHDVSRVIDETGRALESSDTVSGIRTAASFATSTAGTTLTTKTLADATTTVMATAAGTETTRTFNVTGMPGTGALTTNVKSHNYAHIPQMWKVVLPGVGGFYRTDVFDAQGRMLFQMDQTGATYHYDPRTGLKTSESVYGNSLLPTQTATYTYTDAGRLATSIVNTATANYVFDGAGQIVSAGATALAYSGGRLATSTVGGATTTYTYDSRGRRTTQSSSSQQATFTWDAHANRLTAYSLDNAPFGSPDVTAAFNYDASGQRTRSVVTSAGVTTTSTYTYEGLQLTRLVSVTAGVTSTLTYLYDELGRPLVITASFSDTSAVYPVSPGVNAHGDVRGIVDMNLKPVVSWTYDVYGNPSAQATAATTLVPAPFADRIAAIQPLRYAGYAYDSFSGLYYCSQRYYDPATMQFISADPAKADGEESAYQYCGGDPVGKADSSGLYAHAFVPTGNKDQTSYFMKVMEVDAGRVVSQMVRLTTPQFVAWFLGAVETGGPWDLKQVVGEYYCDQTNKVFKFKGRWISADDFGNIHFGYLCGAILSSGLTVLGATAVSIAHKKSLKKTYDDAMNVWYGYDLYQQYRCIIRRPDDLDRFIYNGHVTVQNMAIHV